MLQDRDIVTMERFLISLILSQFESLIGALQTNHATNMCSMCAQVDVVFDDIFYRLLYLRNEWR